MQKGGIIMWKEEQKGNVQRYVDILSDAGFKAVFGEKRNKDVLIDLLNVVLPERKHIMDIRYATTELPGFTLENKSVRLDLRCTGDDGTEFIVEVQRYAQENIFRRCILYASQVYSSGTERGDGQEYCIPPVYLVCLIDDHAMIADRSDPIFKDRIITEYTFREKIIEDVPDETIFCIFVELNRFEKSLEECKKISDKWCYALKHIWTLDSLPNDLKTETFERLFKACEISRFGKEQKLSYEKNMITERDHRNIINTARKEGIREGETKAERMIARKMLEAGMDNEAIMNLTGLTSEDLRKL